MEPIGIIAAIIGFVVGVIGFVASVIQLIDFWQKRQEKRRLKQGASFQSALLLQTLAVHPAQPSSSRQDWGEAIAAPTFYGRDAELNQLSTWIGDDYCRLIAILGIGGIGKTTLSIQLGRQIQAQFEIVIWRSLREAPPLEGCCQRC
jgi:hypothetical protein